MKCSALKVTHSDSSACILPNESIQVGFCFKPRDPGILHQQIHISTIPEITNLHVQFVGICTNSLEDFKLHHKQILHLTKQQLCLSFIFAVFAHDLQT